MISSSQCSLLWHLRSNIIVMMMFSVLYALLSAQTSILTPDEATLTTLGLPVGIGFTILLLKGPYLWPALLFGSGVANGYLGHDWRQALGMAMIITLETMVGVCLLTRYLHFDRNLSRTQDLLKLIVSASIGAGIGTAAINGMRLALTHSADTTWFTLLDDWKTNTFGIVLASALSLIWCTSPLHWRSLKRWSLALVFCVCAFFSSQTVFMAWLHPKLDLLTLGYWMSLFVILGALSFGRHGASLVIVITYVQVLYGMSHDPLFFSDASGSQGSDHFWPYGFVLTIVNLFLAITLEERERIAHGISELLQRDTPSDERSTHFRAAVETLIDGFLMFNKDGRIIEVNDAYLRLSGYERDELLNMTLFDMEPEQRSDQTTTHMNKILQKGQDWFETTHRTKKGRLWPAEVSISRSPLCQNVFFCFIKDLTERKKWEKQLWHQANFDPLTNLPNRLLFYDRLSTALLQARRNDHAMGLIFLDLDGFKPVNDRYGHDAGDWALKSIADRWSSCIRKNDMLARLGGDEFAVIIAKLEHPDEAIAVAKKLIDALSSPILLANDIPCLLGVSAGIGLYPRHGLDMDSLLHAADSAMYASKAKGKNTFSLSNTTADANPLNGDLIVFDECYQIGIPELDEQHRHLVYLSNQLSQAIQNQATLERVKQLFDELMGYTAFHFETEHELMARYDYPGLAEHEQQHASLAHELDAIAQRANQRMDLSVLQNIKDWLFVDINQLDKHWAMFIRCRAYQEVDFGDAVTSAECDEKPGISKR